MLRWAEFGIVAIDLHPILNRFQIGTAAAAMMAIRILLDHGVCEGRIVFITFVVARYGGVSVLRRAFPGVRIVTGAVDSGLRDGWLVGTGTEGKGRSIWVIGNALCECGLQFIQLT
jgi:uridine kinase